MIRGAPKYEPQEAEGAENPEIREEAGVLQDKTGGRDLLVSGLQQGIDGYHARIYARGRVLVASLSVIGAERYRYCGGAADDALMETAFRRDNENDSGHGPACRHGMCKRRSGLERSG
jgi:hypothetical protein